MKAEISNTQFWIYDSRYYSNPDKAIAYTYESTKEKAIKESPLHGALNFIVKETLCLSHYDGNTPIMEVESSEIIGFVDKQGNLREKGEYEAHFRKIAKSIANEMFNQ